MATQYFVTKKETETGSKFQAIQEKASICIDAQRSFAEKHGFSEWRHKFFCFAGGFSSCGKFEQIPDSKTWGKGLCKNEYFPKGNSKSGKLILLEIGSLPTISFDDLNHCIGFDDFPKHIGFCPEKNGYIGFSIKSDWGISIPKDCREVNFSQYKRYFNL